VEVSIFSKELLKLYQTGKSKKYALPSNVLKSFFEIIEILRAAENIYDLWKEPSLNFERLKGTEKRYSLRLSGKFRLEITIDGENEDKTVGSIVIEEISSHYS
jgi:plasmid maintenance system killer protein